MTDTKNDPLATAIALITVAMRQDDQSTDANDILFSLSRTEAFDVMATLCGLVVGAMETLTAATGGTPEELLQFFAAKRAKETP